MKKKENDEVFFIFPLALELHGWLSAHARLQRAFARNVALRRRESRDYSSETCFSVFRTLVERGLTL